jgi:hypothetical protein
MKIVRIDKFVQEKDDPVDWIWQDMLPNTNWGILFGQSGIGKSTFLAQLCEALQTGKPFLNRKTIKTKTLYVQADTPAQEWRERLKQVSPTSTAYTVVGVPDGVLSQPRYVEELRKYIESYKPGFIVFDSFYMLTHVDLNSKQALVPIESIKRLALDPDNPGRMIPWFLIHHPPHGESRPSGNNSIMATCGNIWGLMRNKLEITKARLRAKGTIALEQDKHGLWKLKSEVSKMDKGYDEKLDRY